MSARNEEKYLPAVLSALWNQTYPLQEVVVVNDGSTDNTEEVALSYNATVVNLPYHPHKLFLEPGGLAKRFNVALGAIGSCEYVLILGSDDLLPKNYVEVLVERLESDPKLVMASGQMKGYPSHPLRPRGSGRIVKVWFWKQISDLQFPVISAWEEHMVYKALQLGYDTRAFSDIQYERLREECGRQPIKAFGDGQSMYSLGYYWVYVLFRVVWIFIRKPKEAYFLFMGWRSRRGVKRADMAEWLSEYQKHQIIFGSKKLLLGKLARKVRIGEI